MQLKLKINCLCDTSTSVTHHSFYYMWNENIILCQIDLMDLVKTKFIKFIQKQVGKCRY